MSILTYEDWRDTCNTEHMLVQMMGKVKLESMAPQPEWKQVVLDADADGFTTGLIPAGADGFEVRLSIADAEMRAETTAGDRARFPIRGRASVSELYSRFMAMLENIGHPVQINPVPQEMYTEVPFDQQTSAHEFDEKAAQRSFRQFLFARGALSAFSAPFRGKKIPPSLFWGTFDLTTVLFSGKPCPFEQSASMVERVAFDEQFVECGFWPGDANANEPAFFVLAYPSPNRGPQRTRALPKPTTTRRTRSTSSALKTCCATTTRRRWSSASAARRSPRSCDVSSGSSANGSPSRCSTPSPFPSRRSKPSIRTHPLRVTLRGCVFVRGAPAAGCLSRGR